jgi:hypothetical protein
MPRTRPPLSWRRRPVFLAYLGLSL